MSQSVYAIATMDTKGHELAFVAERLRDAGVAVVTVDVGTTDPPVVHADIDRRTVAGFHPTAIGRASAFRDRSRPGDHRDERSAGILPHGEHESGRLAG